MEDELEKNEEKILKSQIFKDDRCSDKYMEIFSKDNECVKLIFISQEILNKLADESENSKIVKKNLNKLKEITLIIDYPHLAEQLDTQILNKLIAKFYTNIDSKEKTKFNLVIKNCYIDESKMEKPITQIFENNNDNNNSNDNKLVILNKLEINDELYSISIYLNSLFPNIKVNELILRKFKFNSKAQLENFYKFIRRVECTKLTLNDFFIELIIRENENDLDYKFLDKYIAYLDGIITLDNFYTNIKSLTLRDCPLFAIIGNMFTNSSVIKNIDIDENSLINPSIITQFKIFNGYYDICFDLDSYKLKLESESEEDESDYDSVDYLIFIFKIITSFNTENEKIKINKDDDDGVQEMDRKNFHKLTFRNFDITKFGYVMNDDLTYIEEKDWVLDKEEKIRKEKWENLENDLENFDFKEDLSNVKELVFDNCSNFFIKWILNFVIQSKNKNINKEKNNDFDLDLIKIKKCGKEYVDLSQILTLKINKLVLFDTPLIIGEHFSEDDILKEYKNLGTVENLTLKINSLHSYGEQNNLNTYQTLKIFVELIMCPNFNNNITFELAALSNIMTYIAYEKYIKTPAIFFDSQKQEEGEDLVILKIKESEDIDKEEIFIEKNPKSLPKQMFFSAKMNRDNLCYRAFNIENLEGKTITIKNASIKKQTENLENLNYLYKKVKAQTAPKSINSTSIKELQKIDYGSDGFYIDRDYKLFFSENKIKSVILNNVNFSCFKDNAIRSSETEAIFNLISDNKYEIDSIKANEYNETHFPNYKIDVPTLSEVFLNNFGFEDFSIMFKYYVHKIPPPSVQEKEITGDIIEKKNTLNKFFISFKNIFRCFIINKIGLTVIINGLKELKDFYIIYSLYNLLENGKWINDKLKVSSKVVTILLPDKNEIEDKFKKFFIMEKDEHDVEKYSKINYYYISEEEKKMIKDKMVKVQTERGELIFTLEFNTDDIYTGIDDFN